MTWHLPSKAADLKSNCSTKTRQLLERCWIYVWDEDDVGIIAIVFCPDYLLRELYKDYRLKQISKSAEKAGIHFCTVQTASERLRLWDKNCYISTVKQEDAKLYLELQLLASADQGGVA